MIQTPSQIIALNEHRIELGKLDQLGWHGALQAIIGCCSMFNVQQTNNESGDDIS
jgi:hypothetical protein